MAKDVLTLAKNRMSRRKFDEAIKLLEDRAEFYEDNFTYYLLLGIACLYAGDIGTSGAYFQRARKIRLTDTNLLLGQAAIFLRRGDTSRALQYYLEIKDNEPGNKIATAAIEFIRTHGEYETICRWADNGKLEQFYPPLGLNPDKIMLAVSVACACVLGCVLALAVFPKKNVYTGTRADLSSLVLSAEEKASPQEQDLSTQSYKYILSAKQVTQAYEAALEYFQNHRDNMAQQEVNRLLNSNASVSIKQKAQILAGHLEEPTFDTLTDNPSFGEVEKEPSLYLDCWVVWGGRISDAEVHPDGSYSCRLLVGYEDMRTVEGIVVLRFASEPRIEPDLPVRVLAKIASEDKSMYLSGRAVYQSVHGGLKQ